MKYTNEEFALFAFGSVQLDVDGVPTGDPVGAKCPARVTLTSGGGAVNIGRAAPLPKERIAVFGANHADVVPMLVRDVQRFATPIIRARTDALGASMILPRDGDSGRQLLVQRAPLCRADFDEEICGVIADTPLSMAAPLDDTSEDTLDMLRLAARLARRSVLLPHPKLVVHPRFGEIASAFDCVILNAHEAALLVPEHLGLAYAALHLRHLTGGSVEILITNGKRRGLMWAEGEWQWIVPHKIECSNDVGAGDTFGGHYAVGRFVQGLPARIALQRALDAVAKFLHQRTIAAKHVTKSSRLRLAA